jgi:hypothetical protein
MACWVLGGGFTRGDAPADVVSLAVVLQGTAVHHRQIRQLLLEAFGGISALGHGGCYQFVGLGDGGTGGVHEPLLELGPLPGVGLPEGGGEQREVERGEALLPGAQLPSDFPRLSCSFRVCSYSEPKLRRKPCRFWRSRT